MASLQELRRRKKTISSIYRMTSAMKMVSQSKFNRAQLKLKESQRVCEKLEGLAERVFNNLVARDQSPSLSYLEPGNEEAPHLLVVLSSDRGMCGGFNQRLIKEVSTFLIQNPHCEILCVGKIGAALLQKQFSSKIIRVFTHVQDQVLPILNFIVSHFQNGRIRECCVVYNRFHNILQQEPHFFPLLPLKLAETEEGERVGEGLLTYDSPLKDILEVVINLLLPALFQCRVKEHLLSEHGARMAAMDTATENAKKAIDRLQSSYNYLRQSLITKELVEIISGAEALSS